MHSSRSILHEVAQNTERAEATGHGLDQDLVIRVHFLESSLKQMVIGGHPSRRNDVSVFAVGDYDAILIDL